MAKGKVGGAREQTVKRAGRAVENSAAISRQWSMQASVPPLLPLLLSEQLQGLDLALRLAEVVADRGGRL